jgi:hypothetical protein
VRCCQDVSEGMTECHRTQAREMWEVAMVSGGRRYKMDVILPTVTVHISSNISSSRRRRQINCESDTSRRHQLNPTVPTFADFTHTQEFERPVIFQKGLVATICARQTEEQSLPICKDTHNHIQIC